jgi:hypothetical protein
MGNTSYKQYMNNSSEISNKDLENLIGKSAKIECTVPDMKTDSFDYVKMEYGRITIMIYDMNKKIISCINSFYRFDQQMLNITGKIESISIEKKIIKHKRCFIINYLFGPYTYFEYIIKIKLEDLDEYMLTTDEAFRKFNGSNLHIIPEATPSNYYILNHD